MKKLALLLLLTMAVGGALVLADGTYYNNSGTLQIVTDSGGASVSTVDSGIISTPIPAYRFNTLIAKLKFAAPSVSSAVGAGWTDTDTIVARLRTSLSDGQVVTLDSMKLVPPCSLFTNFPLAKLSSDTAWGRAHTLYKDLFWSWKITDTLGDTVVTVNQPFYYEVIAKE